MITYNEYLKINQLLDIQQPQSQLIKQESHDEMLFIITHQTYELWFKQILHELKLARSILSASVVEANKLALIISSLDRVEKIQHLLLDQLSILETMTPMDFLDFRNLLTPSSGIQSSQFRQIEVILGLKMNQRPHTSCQDLMSRLDLNDQKTIATMEKTPSLFELIEVWLERLPFTSFNNFDFWIEYKNAVHTTLDEDEQIILSNDLALSQHHLNKKLEQHQITKQNFHTLFDPGAYKKQQDKKNIRLSQTATMNALFIFIYYQNPIINLHYKLLSTIINIDGSFVTWRQKHASMVYKMLGRKIGSGGSSGYDHLQKSIENSSIYKDLLNLATFIIPRSKVPTLPNDLLSHLDFYSTGV